MTSLRTHYRPSRYRRGTKENRVNPGPARAVVSETPYLIPVSDDIIGGISRFVGELNSFGILVTADDFAFNGLSTKTPPEILHPIAHKNGAPIPISTKKLSRLAESHGRPDSSLDEAVQDVASSAASAANDDGLLGQVGIDEICKISEGINADV
ncbi:hypothetical protein MicloDRAFT_00005240 [Microvirga lotononidis]|uniref:Uncharacterized protein n=1 Tax=Microvirga lotononidis TaxID=864069 RepID=I4Z329_9HYPH|nr:hypothetical protein MicloDRAFT_00005240 [Microvirga lotononidis]